MEKSCRDVCPIFQLRVAHYVDTQDIVNTNLERLLGLIDRLAEAEEQVVDDDTLTNIQKIKEQIQELGPNISQTADISDEVMAQMDEDLQDTLNNCSGIRLGETDKLEVHCGGLTLSSLQILTASMRDIQYGPRNH